MKENKDRRKEISFTKEKTYAKKWTTVISLGLVLCAYTIFLATRKNNDVLDWISLGLVWIIVLLAIIVCLTFEKISDRQMRVLQLAGFVIAILIFSKPLIGMVIHW